MPNPSIPRPEHPRPDFERSLWFNLNGQWEFEFDDSNRGETEQWYKTKGFSRTINVPFCYQSELSKIHTDEHHEILWYKRTFSLPENFQGQRVLVHFGAVDYLAKIWVNGNYVGLHQGGHISFEFEITQYLVAGENTIAVKAEDRYQCTQPRGKQHWSEKLDRCWYTATSGIWQTVWLEAVGEVYIDKVRITPDIDQRHVLAEIFTDQKMDELELRIVVRYQGRIVKKMMVGLKDKYSKVTIDLKEEDYVDETHYWTPENPNLYDIQFELSHEVKLLDSVRSYFGMRKISVRGDMILLNNRPYYQKLVLDQGYWPQSLLTPPSDEAIRYDIEMTKKFGFNGARKHQKIEDPRYYYWADRMGLLVWGEMPSGYDFNTDEMENITREWTEFINRDYNHPCIICWVPLNESWGVRNILVDQNQQSFARSLYHLTKAMDGTRLVSTNDGWENVEADICSIHDYEPDGANFYRKFAAKANLQNAAPAGRFIFSEGCEYHEQPVMVTEYGGIAFEKETKNGSWGYFGGVKDEKDFLERLSKITYAIKSIDYIRGYCYTQLTDVQQEVNGLLTADRKPKTEPEKIAAVNAVAVCETT